KRVSLSRVWKCVSGRTTRHTCHVHGASGGLLMATVIFVHGTSIRKAGYEASLVAVRQGLSARLIAQGREPITVADCLWGDSLGVRLNAGGRSIPEYETTGGAAAPQEEEDQALLWEMLTYDPLYELHGLALRPRRAAPMFDHQEFIDAVRALPSEA